ncbi:hypothetical protein QE152_g38277 [Popillia japonica]|uniref:Uncharacterized protein n=1 Tax=Popillia japonica TaxID=7064 RepID=A0AAW1HYR9_POPJA
MQDNIYFPVYNMDHQPTKAIKAEEVGYIAGWRAILLIQFQPQFEFVIYTSILLSYVTVMIDFAHAIVLNGLRTDFHIKEGESQNLCTFLISSIFWI